LGQNCEGGLHPGIFCKREAKEGGKKKKGKRKGGRRKGVFCRKRAVGEGGRETLGEREKNKKIG